jgi:Cell division septal protein
MSREELLSAALLRGNERLVTLDCSRVEAALAAEPRIASAKVSKVFPNGLRIAVVERAAVATALAELDGRTVAIGIDAQGVAFAESSAASSLPVVSGLRFEGFKPGTRLPASLSRLFASLGEIQAKEPELLAAVSEIRVVKSSGGGEPELVLYPLHQAIPVRAGASLDAATLRSMILVLDVLGTRGIAPTVSEIDFRDGSVVYRGKEGHSD